MGDSVLCSKMKLLVFFLISSCLSAEARKFRTALDVSEHLQKVECEELNRAVEKTAEDALATLNALDRVMKAESRLPDLTGCINCAVELIPNVMECLPGGLNGFLTKLNAGLSSRTVSAASLTSSLSMDSLSSKSSASLASVLDKCIKPSNECCFYKIF